MTMEIDALHAGQPMRNSLDPCNTCADWLALKAENDRLRAELAEVTADRAQWIRRADKTWHEAHAVNKERERWAAICRGVMAEHGGDPAGQLVDYGNRDRLLAQCQAAGASQVLIRGLGA